MEWPRLLAYIPGRVDKELLVRNEYLAAENRILRAQVEGTYLLTMRCPAYRRHDSYLGFRTEPENRVGDDKGKGTSEPHEAESTDAPIRGALLRKSEEAG